jgi:hypothetical protein
MDFPAQSIWKTIELAGCHPLKAGGHYFTNRERAELVGEYHVSDVQYGLFVCARADVLAKIDFRIQTYKEQANKLAG